MELAMSNKSHQDNQPKYILYVGNYLDEAVIEERGLPTRNPAGSNRMRRLAEALSTAKQRVILFSPAVSLRIPWKGKFFHLSSLRSTGKVPVLFCATVGLPLLGVLLEPFFLLKTLQSFARQRPIEAVIVYNFSPTLVLVALWVKLFWKVPLINNIEDISEPKWIDWLPQTEVRPLQQVIFSICMKIIIGLSDGIVIPTKKFTRAIPSAKPYLIVSGCMPVSTAKKEVELKHTNNFPIQLLYAGKVEFEHGIQHLLQALSLLSQEQNLAEKISVHICGGGSKVDWVINYIEQLKTIDIQYHGFISDLKYQNLLSKADVCIALQDPLGRYSVYKTPSKVYEFLGNGKMVIATEVGDLSQLPSEVITLCNLNSEKSLYRVLIDSIGDGNLPYRKGLAAANYAREHFAYPVVGKQLSSFIVNLPIA
jgi:glycosyltransferase involved in cell wall biosynthesis